jgi:hypothetical protein
MTVKSKAIQQNIGLYKSYKNILNGQFKVFNKEIQSKANIILQEMQKLSNDICKKTVNIKGIK